MNQHCKYEILKKNMQNIHGSNGEKWITDLPGIVDNLRDLWELKNIKPVDNMTFHFVAKAETEFNQPVVIKIGLDKTVTESEVSALRFFNGHAAVKLLDYDSNYHALLLQQAIPGKSLKSIYPEKCDCVIDEYINTINKLHCQKNSDIHLFIHISEWLSSLDRIKSDKIPKNLLNKAIQLKNHLLNTSKNEIILHGDLHHDNVILNGTEWIVIDPKGVIGEAEFEIAAFDVIHSSEFNKEDLRKLFDSRIKRLSEKSKLDFQRIKDWFFVRLILSAVWSVEDKSDPSWAINLVNIIY